MSGGGGGGGSSEGGLRLLPPLYFQLFLWRILLLSPRPPSPDDGYEEGDFEEEDFADD